MATAKTMHGPVVAVGDKHYDLGIDGYGRLCELGSGLVCADVFWRRSQSSRAGIWTEPDGKGGLFCAMPSADGCTWVPLEPPTGSVELGTATRRANYEEAKAKLGADANPPTHKRRRDVADRVRPAPATRRAGWASTVTPFDGKGATVESGATDFVLDEPLQFVGTMSIGPGGLSGDDFKLVSPAEAGLARNAQIAASADGAILHFEGGDIPAETSDRMRAHLDAMKAIAKPTKPAAAALRRMGVVASKARAVTDAMHKLLFNGPLGLWPNPGRAFAQPRKTKPIGVDYARGKIYSVETVWRLGLDGKYRRVDQTAMKLPAGLLAGPDLNTPEGRHQAQLRMVQDSLAAQSHIFGKHHRKETQPMDTDTQSLTEAVVVAARASLLPTDKGAALKVAADALVKAYGFDFNEAIAAVTGAVRVADSVPAVREPYTGLDEIRRKWCGKTEPNRDDYDRGLTAADAAVRKLTIKQRRTAELLADELVADEYGDAARGSDALDVLQAIREDLAIPADMSTLTFVKCLSNTEARAAKLLRRCWNTLHPDDEDDAVLLVEVKGFLDGKATP